MKNCPNPDCNPAFLYGSERTTCPFCHSALVNSGGNALLRPADRISVTEPVRTQDAPFIKEIPGGLECCGRIIEIDHQELFHSKLLKLFNSLFRGEPYQFAHQTIEYTIRVESLADEFPADVTDFCLYGSYLGRMQIGDEVLIQAKNKKNRRIVKSIYNQTTESQVKPGLQLSAPMIRAGAALLILLAAVLIVGVIQMFRSGAAAALFSAMLIALLPTAIVIWIILSCIKGLFRR